MLAIPHRRPWLLVDRLLSATSGEAVGEKRVAADDPLVVDGALPESLLLEALAQTAAACHGAGHGEHRGMLVAATDVRFEGRAHAGETVALRVRREAVLGALVRFAAKAYVGERLLVSGTLTFALG